LDLLKNEQIPSGLYTLIDIDRTNLGVKPIAKIREICEENEYDCVLVNSNVRPGIVKLEERMDESKRKYQEAKNAKKNKQKEIKSKSYTVDKPLTIQENDLNRKMNEVINAVRKNYSVTFTFKAMGRYADQHHWKDVVKRFDTCYDYIMSHENITSQTRKENENTIYAVFRYTTKK
jgi:translation initiation factor IF-3